jgi:hypothetical protein
MKKALIVMTAIGVAGAAAVVAFAYWDKILSYATTGARVATNVLTQFTGDNVETDDPTDYYDL